MTTYWHAVALSEKIRRKPHKTWFQGAPVVLFRTDAGIQALYDRCPHRFAELSKGRIVGQTIECPYHGWAFGGDGQCTAIPGHLDELPTIRVKPYAATEADGVIFLSNGTPEAAPYTHCMHGQDIVSKRVISQTNSTLVDVAENILDATHTHYTHKGILRGLSSQRYQVDVAVTSGPDWVEATYTGEEKQQGLVSKLLEGTRTKGVGRFRAPGIAELEYWGPSGLMLATTFHLRESQPGKVDGVGWLCGPRQNGLGHIKALFFKPLFNVALRQDQHVLSSALENAANPPKAKPVIGPLDFLREDIERIIAGRTSFDEKTRYHRLEL